MMINRISAIALIPARSGSKRLVDKNIRRLAGHPLIAYTLCVARQSKIFSSIVVSTDSEEYAEIARQYGAEVPFIRPAHIAQDLSPDIEWVEHALQYLRADGRIFNCFSILRPTNPFRNPETIKRAWEEFKIAEGVDSLRAVNKCHEHPAKMWIVRGKRMVPLLPFESSKTPWHSTPYQALPEVYVQNASLEIAWTRVITDNRTISGEVVMPFITQDFEGFDLNRPEDWVIAEELIKTKQALLPTID